MRGIRPRRFSIEIGIVLARLAVRVDHQIPEPAIGSHALRVRVADQGHDGPVQRDGHVQRSRVGRQHQRRAIEDADELPQSAARAPTAPVRSRAP
jgi:hypothetical protein